LVLLVSDRIVPVAGPRIGGVWAARRGEDLIGWTGRGGRKAFWDDDGLGLERRPRRGGPGFFGDTGFDRVKGWILATEGFDITAGFDNVEAVEDCFDEIDLSWGSWRSRVLVTVG